MSPVTWSVPMASAAIAAVMVCPGSSGFTVKAEPPRAGGDGHDHRLADGPGDTEDQGGHDAGDGGREDDPERPW